MSQGFIKKLEIKITKVSKEDFNFVDRGHRHLSNIDCLTAHTACLVCFSSSVNGRSKRKRKEAYQLLRPALVAGT